MIDDTQIEGEGEGQEEDADPTQPSKSRSEPPLLSHDEPTEISLLVKRMAPGARPERPLTRSGDETEEGDWHGSWEETDPDGIPGYLLERRLGAGGMGEVYVASSTGPDTRDELIALKVLTRVSATRLFRFKREFRSLADVQHPNLIDLYELGVRGDGRAFFTMELLSDAFSFVAWVRRDDHDHSQVLPSRQVPLLERLEDALRQLLEGVAELHRRGYVHRDLKPSNVLVTPDARVVVLDFGLVSTLDDDDEGVTVDGQIVGTPAYMAPEQARGERVSRAADLYAVGVMLYESITGQKPREGSALQLLANTSASVDLRAALADVPSRLRKLCLRLLAGNPEARPSASEALATLTREQPPISGSHTRAEPFLGRREELQHLQTAYFDSELDPVVVHLRGGSGLGKSALLRELRVSLRADACVVLHGRCREREAVPYKGVDALVDSLSVQLRRLDSRALRDLRPRSVGPLVRMFPVLGELWPDSTLRRLNPKELRGVGSAALRGVLTTLSEQRRVVLMIDDFQWSDVDSVKLLTELLLPPRPPKLLLILVLRDELGTPAMRQALATSPSIGAAVARELELGPLPETEARELATVLARAQENQIKQRAPGSEAIWAESVALRSGGNPFFIAQMVLDTDANVADPADLDVFVVRRLAELDAPSRQALEVIAVSGGPIDEDLVLGLCEDAAARHLVLLRATGLIVKGARTRVEAAHDRIREATLAQLEPHVRARLHAQLGEALLARCEDPPRGELLFRIVDQLDAGLGDREALEQTQRLELARLNLAAGEGALDMASPGLALRYFEQAEALASPWIAAARRGEGHHELCVAITLGRARTSSDNAEANAIYERLLDWTLAPQAYGEIVIDHFWSLFEAERSTEAVALGITALRKLGVPLPRQPSLPWMMWNLLLGRRAARELEPERLLHMKPVADESKRAAMSIMALVSWWGTYVGNPFWGIGLAGIHARMVSAHGFHDLAGLGLCMHSVHLFQAIGANDAFALHSALATCEQRQSMGATDRANLKMWLPFMAAYRSPFHESVDEFDAALLACLEIGQTHIAIPYFITGIALRMWSGRQINETLELIQEVRSRSGRLREFHVHVFEVLEGTMHGLLEGPERLAAIEQHEFEVVGFRHMFVTSLAAIELCFGEYERVERALEEAEQRSGFHRTISMLSEGPLYAVSSVIVMAERWPTASPPERRSMRRTIRKRRKLATRWAKRCEENWGPMVALIDAEIAVIEARFDHANLSYERARKLAGNNRNLWIAGLALQRMAILAQRREQPLIARAVYTAARECYSDWGASALVRHIDRILDVLEH